MVQILSTIEFHVTHGLMLKRSLPASAGAAGERVLPLSAPLLSVQAAAPPAGGSAGGVGLVGLVGVEAFLL